MTAAPAAPRQPAGRPTSSLATSSSAGLQPQALPVQDRKSGQESRVSWSRIYSRTGAAALEGLDRRSSRLEIPGSFCVNRGNVTYLFISFGHSSHRASDRNSWVQSMTPPVSCLGRLELHSLRVFRSLPKPGTALTPLRRDQHRAASCARPQAPRSRPAAAAAPAAAAPGAPQQAMTPTTADFSKFIPGFQRWVDRCSDACALPSARAGPRPCSLRCAGLLPCTKSSVCVAP